MQNIEWDDFLKVELRVGEIISAEVFAKARKPAYILHIYFGEDIGVKKSSAQITDFYQLDDLIGKQVVAVVNFPKKQIGSIQSECLVTGFHNQDGHVVLCVPDTIVPLGTKLL
ncbi:tRNA-binding protein [Acinetobacter sp. 1207_04]|uniref:tRNA-binding protein n=1 Tax=Acinetobacter sp. 1207_04 TaxID=2604449 RepID=UPI0030509B14